MQRRKSTAIFQITHGILIRTVTQADGRQYEHRCDFESFKDVVYALEEQGMGTISTIHASTELPYTRINVALEFVKERSCVNVFGRKSYPASKCLFEDAMIEWHALAKG